VLDLERKTKYYVMRPMERSRHHTLGAAFGKEEGQTSVGTIRTFDAQRQESMQSNLSYIGKKRAAIQEFGPGLKETAMPDIVVLSVGFGKEDDRSCGEIKLERGRRTDIFDSNGWLREEKRPDMVYSIGCFWP
jgi:hypothetical protein